MRDFEVYGIPLRIHTAKSKAEAIEFLKNSPPYLSIAVTFIDVVMETDQAGLELCQYIREARGDKITQLFIRTGQPGIAPERAVIDRYDINGYFTKAEATEDKLYSLVKSGIRQYTWSYYSTASFEFFMALNKAAGSREKLAATLQNTIEFMTQDLSGTPVDMWEGMNQCTMIGDEVIAKVGWEDEKAMLALRDRLKKEEGTSTGVDGVQYIHAQGRQPHVDQGGDPAGPAGRLYYQHADLCDGLCHKVHEWCFWVLGFPMVGGKVRWR